MLNITKIILAFILPVIFCLLIFASSLMANDELHFQKEVIVVKFTEHAEKILDIKSVNNIALSGIPSIDQLNIKYKAIKMERAFHYAGKHEQRHRDFGLHKWYYFKFQEDTDVREFINLYQEDSQTEIAELSLIPVLNVEKRTQQKIHNLQSKILTENLLIPNDPMFNQQWHYHSAIYRDIDLPEAWDIQTGDTSVIVSIMDTGADLDHPDLLPNLWINKDEIPNNGVDDDNNGYIDDIHGWNFDQNNNDPSDYQDHGTHTAGTVAAATNNQIGVAGVAGGFGNNDGARLMICRVLGPGGGSPHNAFIYAADNGSVISSNSWGYISGSTPVPYPYIVRQAIDYFIANAGSVTGSPIQGGVVVTSAGNEGGNFPNASGAYHPVIAVAATDPYDAKASFSNYGTWVDISAPGVAVMSTFNNGGYGSMQGTSQACPHVSGVLALMASEFPGITNTNARSLVEFAVDNIDIQNPAYIGMLGSGRLNASYVVQDAAALQQGTVTDFSTSLPLDNIAIEELSSGRTVYTDASGVYELKLFGSGQHAIRLSTFAYQTIDDTINLNPAATLGEIQTLIQDYQLNSSPLTTLSGSLVDSVSGSSTQGDVIIYAVSNKTNVSAEAMVDTTTDVNGSFSTTLPANEDYQVTVTPVSPFPPEDQIVVDLPIGGAQITFEFNPAEVLLVDDDNGADYENYFIEDFQAIGRTYHHWDVQDEGVPMANDRIEYPEKIIVWFTGDSSSMPLTQSEHDELVDHISTSGKLFLTGQDIAEYNTGDSLLNLMGIGFKENTNTALIFGAVGDLIGDGLTFFSSGGGGAQNQKSRDAINIIDSTTTTAIAHYIPGTSKPAGVRYNNSVDSSRAVFLGFGYEAINDNVQRQTLLTRVLEYFSNVTTGINDDFVNSAIPKEFELMQNYPNPFNPETTIKYSIREKSKVSMTIFNNLGQKVRTLLNKNISAGQFAVSWNGLDDNGKKVPSGVYFYQMLTDKGFNNTKKLLLLK